MVSELLRTLLQPSMWVFLSTHVIYGRLDMVNITMVFLGGALDKLWSSYISSPFFFSPPVSDTFSRRYSVAMIFLGGALDTLRSSYISLVGSVGGLPTLSLRLWTVNITTYFGFSWRLPCLVGIVLFFCAHGSTRDARWNHSCPFYLYPSCIRYSTSKSRLFY